PAGWRLRAASDPTSRPSSSAGWPGTYGDSFCTPGSAKLRKSQLASKPQASAGRPQASPVAGRLRPAATVSKYRFGIGTENLQPYRLIANRVQGILDQGIVPRAEGVDEER